MVKNTLVYVIIPLLVGILIYYFFRIPNYDILKWLNIEMQSFDIKCNPPDWFIYNFQDGLWIFSFLNLILIVHQYTFQKYQTIWLLVPLLTAISLELAQKLKLIGGTFDWFDLLFFILGYGFSIALNKKRIIINN